MRKRNAVSISVCLYSRNIVTMRYGYELVRCCPKIKDYASGREELVRGTTAMHAEYRHKIFICTDRCSIPSPKRSYCNQAQTIEHFFFFFFFSQNVAGISINDTFVKPPFRILGFQLSASVFILLGRVGTGLLQQGNT